MEEIWTCKVCGIREAWTTEEAALLASVHHLYKAHPAEFASLGIDKPTDRPESLGVRFEQWELQS